ncbi:MAG: aspartate aminotransferase family protein [Breznakibacter sp.]
MNLFDVYPLFDINPIKALDCTVWDDQGKTYLDLYGGHAVISVGHSHPHYIKRISEQLNKIGFYSNSVKNPMQEELALKLGKMSQMEDYALFLCNSGAEANENAMKLASFQTGRTKILAFRKGFHGRTSAAVAATDNPKIVAPLNANHEVVFVELNDTEGVEQALAGNDVAAVIIEGIQGIGGIRIPKASFLREVSQLCRKHGTMLILDEIQSGYGRSGKFFAFQYAGITPDMVTMAKGMGNGFPVGGVLISPRIKPIYGMLGTTFGGNYLAAAASLAVLEIMEEEKLVENAKNTGDYMLCSIPKHPSIKEVRGLGLMIGIEFNETVQQIRNDLLHKNCIFTGVSGSNTIRLLPPLTLKTQHVDTFIKALEGVMAGS